MFKAGNLSLTFKSVFSANFLNNKLKTSKWSSRRNGRKEAMFTTEPDPAWWVKGCGMSYYTPHETLNSECKHCTLLIKVMEREKLVHTFFSGESLLVWVRATWLMGWVPSCVPSWVASVLAFFPLVLGPFLRKSKSWFPKPSSVLKQNNYNEESQFHYLLPSSCRTHYTKNHTSYTSSPVIATPELPLNIWQKI